MDPLTAFSLACGVIQVIDFSTKTLMKCKEIYKEGSLSDHRNLEDSIKHLIDIREKLDLPDATQRAESPIAANDQSLIELSRQCSATADQLVEKLHSLRIQGPHERPKAIFKTVKSLWEKGEIEEIQKRLDRYQTALDTQILVSLRSVWLDFLSSVYPFKLRCTDIATDDNST